MVRKKTVIGLVLSFLIVLLFDVFLIVIGFFLDVRKELVIMVSSLVGVYLLMFFFLFARKNPHSVRSVIEEYGSTLYTVAINLSIFFLIVYYLQNKGTFIISGKSLFGLLFLVIALDVIALLAYLIEKSVVSLEKLSSTFQNKQKKEKKIPKKIKSNSVISEKSVLPEKIKTEKSKIKNHLKKIKKAAPKGKKTQEGKTPLIVLTLAYILLFGVILIGELEIFPHFTIEWAFV
jgi:hypothetical protein